MPLGTNYLGSQYLGGGYAGTYTPPAPPYEGLWIYATPTGTLQSESVNQFLELHGVTVVGQGSPVVSVSGGLTTWQALGEISQPFIAPANVGWFRIPLSSTELAPTLEAGWANAAPITVSIYTDNAGIPGTLVATTVIPAEQIETVQLPTWPEPDDLLFGIAVQDAQASLPQLPGSGWTGTTTLVAGSWGVMFATQGSNDTQMWVVPFDGSDLGAWIAGSALPVSGFSQVVYAANAQVLVILSGRLMWAASFDQTGTVGSWQSLPGVTADLIGILTYEGSDYLIGIDASGQSSYTLLSASASIGNWVTGLAFPIGFTSGENYQVGSDSVFIIQSGDATTLVSISVPGGGWSVSGTLSTLSSRVLGMVDSSVITTNGSSIIATALTEIGTAPWSFPVPFSALGSDVTLLAFDAGTEFVAFWLPSSSGIGYQQQVYVPSWVNVPLPQSLTAGNKYHLVLSASNSLTVGVAIPVVTNASEIPGLIYNGTSWVSLGGVIPFLAFYGGGPPLAFVAVGKTTLLWFDTPSGDLTTSIELVGNTSNSRSVAYSGGMISQVA